MKVRVLYPTALPNDAEAGEVVDVAEGEAKAWIAAGFAELEKPTKEPAKAKAPGEKSTASKPKAK